MLIARRLFKYVKPHIKLVFLSIVLGAVVSAAEPGALYAVGEVLNRYFSIDKQDPIWLFKLAIVFSFVLFSVQAIGRYFYDYILRYISESTSRAVREEAYNHCIELSLDHHHATSTGVLLSRITFDIGIMSAAFNSLPSLIREPFTAVGFLIVALIRDWKLTLLVLLIVPVCVIVIRHLGKLIKKYTHRLQDRFGDVNQVLQESFYGIHMIQSFNLEERMKIFFYSANQRFFDARMKSNRLEVLSSPLMTVLTISFVCAVLYLLVANTNFFASTFAADNQSQMWVQIASVFIALGLLLAPIKRINSLYIELQKAFSAAERLFQLLDTKPSIQSAPHAIELKEFQNEIVFKNVSFRYQKDDVLKNVNLHIKKGESKALVGQSGSGKTTLAHLIPRFYDVKEGAIEIDGQDIRDYEVHSLREKIAIVSQEVFLFNTTIEENILFGKSRATHEEVVAAAKAAYAHEFIMELPQGYKTLIGDRGVKLSGGQKQRVSIARALLKNAPILILDEATSSLDTESERQVQKALDQLMEGRTSLIIAHRLSTIENAHRIVVLKKGCIIEEGSHKNLLEKGGDYFKYYNLQHTLLIENTSTA
ncbi:MAG TPA: ABC transporter ATP-binding protein [Bdellovibrionota bacterium]|nr:ABC transporter ATP-binding protein [Bdellovibrionota bacterium]